MPQKMFRLTEAEVDAIKRVAEERGCTQTDVIRSCISQLNSDTQVDTQQSASAGSDIIDVLKGQLEIKDKQISDLSSALVAAQEANKALSANAAMHTAADKKEELALESTAQKAQRASRWQRLKEAWRG